MKIIKKENSVIHNSKNFEAREYITGDKDINIAVVKKEGRYPEKGFVVNEVCKELILVKTGTGTVSFKNEKTYAIDESDVIKIEANEIYALEGKLELIISCNPAWYPEQHKNIN